MAESDPYLGQSLRDWLLGSFRTSSQADPTATSQTPQERVTEEHTTNTAMAGPSVAPDVRTHLLESYYNTDPACGKRSCNHGTFSPRPEDQALFTPPILSGLHAGESSRTRPTSAPGSEYFPSVDSSVSALPVKNRRALYFSYYVPFATWITQYRWSFVRGDLVAALTIASIYIPMALSLSENLAHAPPINGLYAFVFHPFIYAILGSCPMLVVGPEAAGSLLIGTIVKISGSQGGLDDDDPAANAVLVGVATAMAGAMVLLAGLTRLGFLDNVLSRPFLRGFITAIGFVILVDQLIPELGLAQLSKLAEVDHGSTVTKLAFLAKNIHKAHGLTTAVSFGSFAVIMVFRTLKRMLEPRYPQVVYFPDRCLLVVLSVVLTWYLGWDQQGLEVLGSTKSDNGLFRFRWPFQFGGLNHIRTAMSTSFIIAILGFFESSVAAKGLGDGTQDGVKGMAVSPNREMVALGVSNVIGGCFMSLPAFGGYARSKMNVSTGAKSPMSNVFLSIISLIVIFVLLPYLYYLPKAVLSAMISVISISLVEECPHDVAFFVRLGGWSELSLMFLIFMATVFYSLELGIALGIGLSILILVRHSTKPRIQILGKVAGTQDRFDNAELHPEKVELVEGALIVKIPEPLTFANTGDLKNRLRRLEFYGTTHAHPSLPRMRAPEHNKNVIFDVHGVTSIDGSGTQVLFEIVKSYTDVGARVFFCRLANSEVFGRFERSGIVEQCGGLSHFLPRVDEALSLAETEDRVLES